MSDPSTLPSVTVSNPTEWTSFAATVERHTARPPSCDLASLQQFVGGCVTALVEADSTRNAGALRGRFSDLVIAQLSRFGGELAGRTVRTVALQLLGTPPAATMPTVRLRVTIDALAPTNQAEVHQQFWDVSITDTSVVVSAARCPNCGATLEPGALVCPYCHGATEQAASVPLLVTKLEHLS